MKKRAKNIIGFKQFLCLSLIMCLPISINFAKSSSNQEARYIFPEEKIAKLIEDGKNYQDLKRLGFSPTEISAGVREHILVQNPIPNVEKLKSIGLDDTQLLHNAAQLIEDEHLSVYDLDDMGFKEAGLMPELSAVLVNQYHYSKDELQGIGFTPDELISI